MSNPNNNILVIIGSGPGIGRAVASLFATKAQSKIALLSRNQDKLLQDQTAIDTVARNSNRSVAIRTWAVDITDEAAFGQVLAEVERWGVPEVVFFNAARVVPSSQLVTASDEIEYDFRVRISAPRTSLDDEIDSK